MTRMPRQNERDGQSAVEYALTIAVVVSACLGMSMYLKRAMMGRHFETQQSFGQQPYLPGRTIADEHLISTGVDVDEVNSARTDDDKILTNVESTFNETLSQTGGDTIFVNEEADPLP